MLFKNFHGDLKLLNFLEADLPSLLLKSQGVLCLFPSVVPNLVLFY